MDVAFSISFSYSRSAYGPMLHSIISKQIWNRKKIKINWSVRGLWCRFNSYHVYLPYLLRKWHTLCGI